VKKMNGSIEDICDELKSVLIARESKLAELLCDNPELAHDIALYVIGIIKGGLDFDLTSDRDSDLKFAELIRTSVLRDAERERRAEEFDRERERILDCLRNWHDREYYQEQLWDNQQRHSAFLDNPLEASADYCAERRG
jgi:hypothetical protein